MDYTRERKSRVDDLAWELKRTNYEITLLLIWVVYTFTLVVLFLTGDQLDWLLRQAGLPSFAAVIIITAVPAILYYVDEKTERRCTFFGAVSTVMLPFMCLTLRYLVIRYPLIGGTAAIVIAALAALLIALLLPDDKERRKQLPMHVRLEVIFSHGKRMVVACVMIALCVLGVSNLITDIRYSAAPGVIPNNREETAGEVWEQNLHSYLYKLNPEDWEQLSLDERQEILQYIVNLECTGLGISNPVRLRVDDLDENTNGEYQHDLWLVKIDRERVMSDSYQNCVQTVLHEVRHCYQHNAVEAYLELDAVHQELAVWDDARAWLEAMLDYPNRSFDYDYDEYYSNQLEVDARRFAREKVDEYVYRAARKSIDDGRAACSDPVMLNGDEVVVLAYDNCIQAIRTSGEDRFIIGSAERFDSTESLTEAVSNIRVTEQVTDDDNIPYEKLVVSVEGFEYVFLYDSIGFGFYEYIGCCAELSDTAEKVSAE